MLENWRPCRLLRVMFVQVMARLAEARSDLVGREDYITWLGQGLLLLFLNFD